MKRPLSGVQFVDSNIKGKEYCEMMIKKGHDIGSLNDIDQNLLRENFGEITARYLEMQHLFLSATREISTKLEILDDEFQFRHKRNPIHHMQSRLKTPKSIFEKLRRKGLEISLESVKENLTDIAGIRVICSYIDDIYMIARMLVAQDDITLVRETDYIKNPKPNGYRSLHLIVKVPVFFSDKKELVPVEVQIRTIAMDLWASLEHQLRYKTKEAIPPLIGEELQKCADDIAVTDLKMQEIYRTLGQYEV